MQKSSFFPHAKALLVLGFPLIGSHLAQLALHVTNTVMLGRYSVEALAGVVLATSAYFIVFFMGSGFAGAVMPLVAAASASRDEAGVRRATRMGIWLSLIFCAFALPVMAFSGPFFVWLGQEPAIAALAESYLQVAGIGLVPALIVMVLKSHLAALGRTQVVLWVTIVAVFVNAASNWVLIFGNLGAPEMGIVGAGISSLLVQVICAVLLCAYAAWLPELRHYRLFQRFWRPDWQAFAKVFRLGWPIGLTSLAEGGLFSATAVMMGWLGTRELAAHGIAMEFAAMTFMVHVGLSNAATIRTGRAFGTGDWVELRQIARTAIILSACFATVAVTIFLAVPEQLISLFLSADDPDRPAILALGVLLLGAAAIFQLGDSMQVMALGLLRGVQDTRAPMIIAAMSYWVVGVPVAYAFGFPLGGGAVGLWLGLAVGLFLASSLMMLRFWRRALRMGGGSVPAAA